MGGCLSCLKSVNSFHYTEIENQTVGKIESFKLPSDFVKRFELLEQVGSGSTSKVFKIQRCNRTGSKSKRFYACKIVDKRKLVLGYDSIEASVVVQQLKKEINILRGIKHHPNIVSFEDYLETKEYLFIILEHLEGIEFSQYLFDNGPLKEQVAKDSFFDLFSAIAHIHDLGVIHRDIKAENIICVKHSDSQFTFKLIDFGFSTVVHNEMTGSFLGTSGYIAPEMRQQKYYSSSVDLWALGVLLYFSLSLRLPFSPRIDLLPPSNKACEDYFQLKFPPELFSSFSQHCPLLIRGLLLVDPLLRLTARQAVTHPWFQRHPPLTKTQPSPSSVASISSPLDSKQLTPSVQSCSPLLTNKKTNPSKQHSFPPPLNPRVGISSPTQTLTFRLGLQRMRSDAGRDAHNTPHLHPYPQSRSKNSLSLSSNLPPLPPQQQQSFISPFANTSQDTNIPIDQQIQPPNSQLRKQRSFSVELETESSLLLQTSSRPRTNR